MRMMHCLFFLTASTAQACLWVQGVMLDGTVLNVEGRSIAHELRMRMEGQPTSLLDLVNAEDTHLDTDPHETAEAEQRETDAVRDVLSGQPREAIAKLTALEEEKPGSYSVAANLGTAYELAGDNQNALKWISAGIERNPDSHHGTEWLHKAILETKIALESDPDFLKKNHVLPFTNALSDGQHFDYNGQKLSLSDVQAALEYQLHERVVFVKPKDPVVADLLFSLGLIVARSSILEHAVAVFELSRDYGYLDTAGLDTQLASYREIIEDSWLSRIPTLIWVLIALVALAVTFKTWQAWRLRQEQTPH